MPLADPVVDILQRVPRFLTSDFMFTTTGVTPVSGFGRAKDRVELAVGATDWWVHDLRRTAASGMARLGVAPHVIEKVLNHKTGQISGVAAVYNRYGYETEKRDALARWAENLTKLRAWPSRHFGDTSATTTESAHQIRLRPAANLTGLALFPYGWKWSEFKIHGTDDQMPYEEEGKTLCRSAPVTPVGEAGAEAVRWARTFRKNQVRGELTRMISRQEVRYRLGQLRFPTAAKELGVRVDPNRQLDKHDFDRLDIEHSTVGIRLYSRTHIWIDAIDLIRNLIERTETRGRKAESDWRSIEIHARQFIERNGFPTTAAELERQLIRPDMVANEPNRGRLQAVIQQLRQEYALK